MEYRDLLYPMARAGLRERKRKHTTPLCDTVIYGEQAHYHCSESKRLKSESTIHLKPGSEDPMSASTTQSSAKEPPDDSDKRCRFLELPRELRDEIYKHVIAIEGPITLKQSNFVTKSALIGINNQITNEFLDTIFLYGPVLTTTVRNNNFAHIVTFLNRLSEAQFARLQNHDTTRKDQKLQRKINIILTYTATKTSTRPQLNRWLDRFDDPNRRGAEIDFQYEIAPGSYDKGGRKQRPKLRSTAGPRSNEEARNILGLRRYPYYM
jgi:hypothetical protein